MLQQTNTGGNKNERLPFKSVCMLEFCSWISKRDDQSWLVENGWWGGAFLTHQRRWRRGHHPSSLNLLMTDPSFSKILSKEKCMHFAKSSKIPIMALNGITGELSNYRWFKAREEEPGLNRRGPSFGVQTNTWSFASISILNTETCCEHRCITVTLQPI